MLGDTSGFGSYSVDDIERAEEFYGRTLGLNIDMDDTMGILAVHLAGGTDVMLYPKDDHQPATFTVLNFDVDDIDRVVEGLTSRGVSFEFYDGFGQDTKGIARDAAPGTSIAWFKDPAGNILSVIHNRKA
ncbi:glyoxalase [Streptomyces maremycinicus]|nr:glyoxalase [Streptomyces sp. B9173]